eukprot:scaffold24823_cov17-Tisochrysis_lutea.AAC.2
MPVCELQFENFDLHCGSPLNRPSQGSQSFVVALEHCGPQRIGLQTSEGRVKAGMQDKFTQ